MQNAESKLGGPLGRNTARERERELSATLLSIVQLSMLGLVIECR